MTTTGPRSGIAPVRKTAHVPQDPAGAFSLFTEHIGEWWPLSTHSVGGDAASGVTFGAAAGERIEEVHAGGGGAVWGTITVWEPPSRVAFTWHPGVPEEHATLVEVTFEPSDDGTVVVLTHLGWERRPDGIEMRERYDTGWDAVLGRFLDAA